MCNSVRLSFSLNNNNLEIIDDFDKYTIYPNKPLFVKINNTLNKFKKLIHTMYLDHQWTNLKKLSNPYELIDYVKKTGNEYTSNVGIANYYPISRSYFKLLEIITDYNLIKNTENFAYAGIAEGPGGFMECVINYRKIYHSKLNKNDKYYGITLIKDDTQKDIPVWNKKNLLFKNKNIILNYGEDNTGNILNIKNIEHFSKFVGKNKIDLVTGDGGFDVSIDYSNQEYTSIPLIFAQILIALYINKIGGTFILKIFDIHYSATIDLLYILGTVYEKVDIIKPYTSRPANSEKYLVCQNYKGISKKNFFKLIKIFNLIVKTDKIPFRFVKNHLDTNFIYLFKQYITNFAKYQITNIIKTYYFYKNKINSIEEKNIKKIQTLYAIKWCLNYGVDINFLSPFYKLFTC